MIVRACCVVLAVGVLAGCGDRPLALDRVEPAVVSALDSTPIQLHGQGFVGVVQTAIDDDRAPTVRSQFQILVGTFAIDLGNVQRIDDTTLGALVPAGLAPALYDVTIIAPDGRRVTRPAALRVATPPTLLAEASATPTALAVGQRTDFVLTVTNQGDTSALATTPLIPTVSGTALLERIGELPPPVDLASGASTAFVFSYRALTAGEATLRSAARCNAGVHPCESNEASIAVSVARAPLLTATAEVAPNPVSIGQAFSLTLTVKNDGGSLASAVTSEPPIASGTGGATLGAPPASQDIGPGMQATFVWTCTATTAGVLSWTLPLKATAPGGDAIASASAGPLVIETPLLTATIVAAPALASTGQTLVVTMTVTNGGTVAAHGVHPTAPLLEGPGGATLLTMPTAGVDLAPGASVDFVWTYTASVPGTLTFVATAAGEDANSGTSFASSPASSNEVVIEAAVLLTATVTTSRATVAPSQLFSIDVTVQNTGGVLAIGVVSSIPMPSGPGQAVAVSSPMPQDIPAGESRTFTWIWQATGVGPTTFTATGSGVDANSGAPVASAPATSGPVGVQAPPALSLTVDATPSPVLEGNSIVVTAVVSNDGESTAKTTVPTLTTSGTGTASLVTGPTPIAIDLGGKAQQTFTWTYVAQSVGMVTFSAAATAQDANDSATVAAATRQVSATILQHAALAVSLAVPSNVAASATFDIVMTVTNLGGNDAIEITPTAITVGGSVGATQTTGPAPASFAGPLAPGGAVTFTWTYQASASGGTATFTGGASGKDATDQATLTEPSATSSPVTIGTPAILGASLSLPAQITRGAPFAVTMRIDNVGGNAATSVTPRPPTILSGTATLLSGPTPSTIDLPAGGETTFTWSYVVAANGALQLGGGVDGTDAGSLQPISATASSNVTPVTDLSILAIDPFGDGTAFAFVFQYNGLIYLGPRGNGVGALRMNPDGSSPEPVSFSIGKDTTGNAMANKAAPPYTSIGYTGCAIDTLQCGPNDENGRGLFATGLLGGVPWLVLAGSRQSGDVEYIYMTNGTGTTLALSWIDLDGPLTDETRGLAAMHVFGDRLYLGFSQAGGNRPILGRLETLPSPPGYNAVAPTNFVDLLAGDMPDIGASAQLSLIDVIGDFNDRLYVANNGGWMRATTATPTPYGTGMDNGWTSTRPTSTDYTAKTSVTTAKSADYEPSDRAVPQLATLNGRYYAARNTTTGPQLWMCDPTLTGGAMDCDPADWTLIARNTLGDTRASQFNASGNAAITLLVATATHLYVGYNNAAGLELWRSTAPLPTQLADFEGANGCPANLHATSCAPLGGQGLGDATNNTRIFAGVVASFNGRDNVYLVSGSGNNGVRVVRIAE